MTRTDRIIRAVLWSLVAADLVWFVAAKFYLYALLLFFVLVALAIAWQGLRFPTSPHLRKKAALAVSGFWTLVAFLMAFPFPAPRPPQYIVGEVHRFSALECGWIRAFFGVLGPNLSASALLADDPARQMEIAKQGFAFPCVTTMDPGARTFFGAAEILDPFRNNASVGGVPKVAGQYAWTDYRGTHRPQKLGWNPGDELFGEVARQLGYGKAKYTPEENTLMVRTLGKWLGSPDVIVSAVDPRWFYSHLPDTMGKPVPLEDVKDLKYAIQIFADQDYRRIHNDPSNGWWSISKSGAAYSTSGFNAVRIAQLLRDMGYEARAGYGPFHYESYESPMSVYGGGGEYSRTSCAVVPSAGGMRNKSATILTNFPLVPTAGPVGKGITRMCANCDRCARACPVNSIPFGEMTVENGVNMWHVDKDKCARYRAGSLNGNCCNVCVAVCPYNKPDTAFHRLGNYIIEHSPLAPYLFGNINGVGLEDWLDFEYSSEAGQYNRNQPARWVLENPGYKAKFPYQVGNYIYTEEDRSTSEDWATGVGAEMGKVGLTYKGVAWGKLPASLVDANGRSINAHNSRPDGRLPADLKVPFREITKEEADRLLKSGQAFSGGTGHGDDNCYPRRSPKYEKGVLSYAQAAKLWQEEK